LGGEPAGMRNGLAWGLAAMLVAIFAGADAFERGLLGAEQTWAALPGIDGNQWVGNLALGALAVLIIATVLKPLWPVTFRHLLKVSGLLALVAALATYTGLGYVGGGVILFASGVLAGIALLGLSTSEREWEMVWGVLVAEGCLLLGELLWIFTRLAPD